MSDLRRIATLLREGLNSFDYLSPTELHGDGSQSRFSLARLAEPLAARLIAAGVSLPYAFDWCEACGHKQHGGDLCGFPYHEWTCPCRIPSKPNAES